MKVLPDKPKSDDRQLQQIWSKLTKGPVTVAEARDLDRTFAGPQDPNLGEEPMFPASDADEEAPVSRVKNRPKTRPLARGEMRANTSRGPLARSTA